MSGGKHTYSDCLDIVVQCQWWGNTWAYQGTTFLGHLPWYQRFKRFNPGAGRRRTALKPNLLPSPAHGPGGLTCYMVQTQTTCASPVEREGQNHSFCLFGRAYFSFWSSLRYLNPTSSLSLLLLQCLWSWLFRRFLFVTEEREAGIKEEHVRRIRIYPGIWSLLFCHMQEYFLVFFPWMDIFFIRICQWFIHILI